MILARITGSVVSTIHHEIVDGKKLLLAERLDQNQKPTGGYLIALDAIGAGQGGKRADPRRRQRRPPDPQKRQCPGPLHGRRHRRPNRPHVIPPFQRGI